MGHAVDYRKVSRNSYHGIQFYMHVHCMLLLSFPSSLHARHLGVETTFSRDANGHVKTSFDYVPSPGRHWLKYKSNFILVQREREKSMVRTVFPSTCWYCLFVFDLVRLTSTRGVHGKL